MALDLRIIFLFLLFVTAIIFTLRKGPALEATEIKELILDFLLVPAALGTVATFGFILTRTDPLPLLREASYQLSFQQNVSFTQAIPPNLQDNLEVASVTRKDTDGDGFNEWVVFYQFDLQTGISPIKAVVYDNDRGNPPIIFPYQLRAPGRDYLSESATSLKLEFDQISEDENGPNRENLEEILVSDSKQLSIFRYRQNSEIWDFPRDSPARYEAIGFFRGNGGVSINASSKNVTVVDRDKFERSQLAKRSVYAFNTRTNSYWDDLVPLGSEQKENPVLAAPVIATIDFYKEPPREILKTPFPEKIVLAFYAATCGSEDDTLCRNAVAGWDPQDFLADDALVEYDNEQATYFGLRSLTNMRHLSISDLGYSPNLEVSSSRNLITGEQPQSNVVDITFSTQDTPSESARYQMGLINGQWKILRRVELLVLDSP